MNNDKYILVCGGAGYIGSHVVAELLENNYNVIVVDNLSTGHFISNLYDKVIFFNLDISDIGKLRYFVFDRYNIDTVINLASHSIVSESQASPLEYWNNNVSKLISLFKIMLEYNINKFIFSSTAAVYGNPIQTPITEDHLTNPINSYGHTKLAIEYMIEDFGKAYGIKSVVFRYFNAAGANDKWNIGENHINETHLIPNIIKSILYPDKFKFLVFGNDYPTRDGTCIRDYIHVKDIADAHIKAIDYLDNNHESITINLGTKTGYSIIEIIKEIESVTGTKLNYEVKDRRNGDPAELIASNDLAYEKLGWYPQHSSINEIITDAWNYHKSQFDLFNTYSILDK